MSHEFGDFGGLTDVLVIAARGETEPWARLGGSPFLSPVLSQQVGDGGETGAVGYGMKVNCSLNPL